MSFFVLIVKNLFRNKRRTFLTLVGVLLSFLLFVSIFTLIETFTKRIKSEAAQVNLFFRPIFMSNFVDGQLPEAYLHQLSKIPLIQFMSPYKVYLATGRSEDKNIFALGVYPDQISRLRNMKGLSPAQLEQFNSEKKAAVVGREIMEQNQWKLGEEVILKGLRGLPDLSIHIVGVMDPASDFAGAAVIRYDYLKDTLKDGGIFSIALLRVESPYQVSWLTQAIRERFENATVPVEAITEKGFLESVISELSSIADSIKFVAWITLLATLFVVGNTMAMSIRERSVEQGVMRTLGFSKWWVFSLYLSEALVLSLVGGLAGGFIACSAFQYFHLSLPGSMGRPSLLIEPYWGSLKEVLVLAVLMGFLAGIPPAYFAMRRKITETLRFVA